MFASYSRKNLKFKAFLNLCLSMFEANRIKKVECSSWFYTNRNRSASLFIPVSSASDRADLHLQNYHKTYSQQQVFSQQQGTDSAHQTCHRHRLLQTNNNEFCLVVDIHHLLYGFPRMCVRRRKGGSTSQRGKLWACQLFHKPCCRSLSR